jgi:hypothetical protein
MVKLSTETIPSRNWRRPRAVQPYVSQIGKLGNVALPHASFGRAFSIRSTDETSAASMRCMGRASPPTSSMRAFSAHPGSPPSRNAVRVRRPRAQLEPRRFYALRTKLQWQVRHLSPTCAVRWLRSLMSAAHEVNLGCARLAPTTRVPPSAAKRSLSAAIPAKEPEGPIANCEDRKSCAYDRTRRAVNATISPIARIVPMVEPIIR